jgi:hypothetical protein
MTFEDLHVEQTAMGPMPLPERTRLARPDPGSAASLAAAQSYLRSWLYRQPAAEVQTAAWDEFYETYTRHIRKLLTAAAVPSSEVDRLTREVWGELTGYLLRFQGSNAESLLRCWLARVVRRKAAGATSVGQWQKSSERELLDATLDGEQEGTLANGTHPNGRHRNGPLADEGDEEELSSSEVSSLLHRLVEDLRGRVGPKRGGEEAE